MDGSTLNTLQPTGETSVEIGTSLGRIATAKVEAKALAVSIQERIKAGALTLSGRDRRQLMEALDDAELDARQCEAAEADLAKRLTAAIDAERAASVQDSYDGLMARMAAHDRHWTAKYHKLDTALRELLAERQAIVDDARLHNRQLQGTGFRVDFSDLEEALWRVSVMPTDAEREAEKAVDRDFYDIPAENRRRAAGIRIRDGVPVPREWYWMLKA